MYLQLYYYYFKFSLAPNYFCSPMRAGFCLCTCHLDRWLVFEVAGNSSLKLLFHLKLLFFPLGFGISPNCMVVALHAGFTVHLPQWRLLHSLSLNLSMLMQVIVLSLLLSNIYLYVVAKEAAPKSNSRETLIGQQIKLFFSGVSQMWWWGSSNPWNMAKFLKNYYWFGI